MELLIKNKKGAVWNASALATDISWKTSRAGKPSTLDVTLVTSGGNSKSFTVENGDIVQFRKDGVNVFYGFVFKLESGSESELKLTAYDQIRYLLGNGTYVLENVTANDVIRRIAKDHGLQTGVMEAAEYTIPSLIQDNKKLLDIIMEALAMTLENKGQLLAFYDDFGELTLRSPASMQLPLIIGKERYLYEYSLSKSIDDNTYNAIFLYQDNKETGKREFYTAADENNVAKWGMLHLYEKADDKANAAQINEKAKMLLKLRNRETIQLSLQAIGDLRVRAGSFLYVLLDGTEAKLHLVDQCSHRFSGGEHTMSLDIRVV